MFAFIIRRIIQALIALLVISVIAFCIKYSFGDPVRELVGVSVSVAEREQLREELGLNAPMPVQWWNFMKNAVQGDFGTSYIYRKPAMDIILEKAPATLELVLVSTLLIIAISIPAGVYCAIRQKTTLSKTIMAVSVIGVSIPVYLFAIAFILLFAVNLGWLPAYGRGPTTLIGMWESNLLSWAAFKHIIMPSVCLTIIMLPLFIRLIRAEMVECMQTEYVKFARAKGLSERTVIMRHAFKNALLPVITMGGVQIGTMIAFTILTETVFQWSGLGFMFISAVNRADTAMLVAYLLFCGVIFVGVNTIVDIIYGFVNPMVRIAGKK